MIDVTKNEELSTVIKAWEEKVTYQDPCTEKEILCEARTKVSMLWTMNVTIQMHMQYSNKFIETR